MIGRASGRDTYQKKREIPAAVDEGGVEEFGREVAEVVPEKQDAHAEVERDLRQHHAPVGVEKPEVADAG